VAAGLLPQRLVVRATQATKNAKVEFLVCQARADLYCKLKFYSFLVIDACRFYCAFIDPSSQ